MVRGVAWSGLPHGLWLLLLSIEQDVSTEDAGSHVTQSFVVPDEMPMQWAHRVLITLLQIAAPDEDSTIRWRGILQGQGIPASRGLIRKAAEDGIETGFVQYVIDQVPETRPAFLARMDVGPTSA